MFEITIYFLIIAFIVQQCTSINITSASIFRRSKLNSFPYLKDGATSDNYVIQQFTGDRESFPSISYSAEHNFFLLDGYPYCKKLDGNGNEIIAIKIVNETAKNVNLAEFTHYIFSENGVYDLSEENIEKILFKKIINQDKLLKRKAWLVLFDEYYKKAQIVIYGKQLGYEFPIYFRIEGEWTKLLAEKGEHRDRGINGLSLKGYPAKFTRTVILKDPLQKTFSNRVKEHETKYFEGENEITNYALKYSNAAKIKPLFYTKESIHNCIAYTPIPIAIAGTAYYQLKVKNETLSFKAKAVKPLFKGLKNHFTWYILPDPYFQKADVSFLYLLSTADYHQIGNNNGLYIIKKKDKC